MAPKERFSQFRKLVAFISSIFVFLVFFLLAEYQAIQDRTVASHKDVEASQDLEWSYLWGITTSLRAQAQERANTIAGSVKAQIIQDYRTNGRDLEKDIKNLDQNNHPIINIFADNLLNKYPYLNDVHSDSNDAFIATRLGIASDFSVDCSSAGRSRSFEKEASLHFSPDLAKKAIAQLLRVESNDSPIGWEFRTPTELAYTVPDFTEGNLQNLYKKYGLSSLAFFEFLSASYIDQKKDLTGKLLVDERGNLTSNNQFIVVQGFNLVEQINNRSDVLATLKAFQGERQEELNRATWDITYLQFMVLAVFAMIILILILGTSLINHEARDLPDELKDGKE